MMLLLAKITKLSINKQYISYEDLYKYNEEELFTILESKNNQELTNYLNEFKYIKKEAIPDIDFPKIKIRNLYPLVDGRRIKE